MGSCYSTICVSNTDREAKVVAAARSGRWKGTLKNNGIDSSFLGRSEALNEVELHRIPGRMFSSGASNLACLFTQQGKKGTNQDAMLVWENFISRSDTVFCGVFDGHGPYGHIVAKKVRDSLPLLLHMQWKAYSNNEQSSPYNNVIVPDGNTITVETASISTDDELYEAGKDEENEKLPKLYFPLRQSMLNAFMLMDKELKLHPGIDCFCSGSTAVTLIKKGQDVVIGNVGDSRAILATRDNDNSLIAVQLTVDLKPNLPREAARIQQCKGRVFALQDEPEVARVWLPNSNSPGLAMARAFGDFCLKDFGLISVPEIYYHRLTERDQFIVLATDGIWDVLSNKEVVDIVASAPGQTTAARALVDSATRAWRLKYPTSKIDDCAAVCLFLNDLHRREVGERVVADEAVGRVDVGRNSNASRASDDIVPVSDPADIKSSGRFHGQSRRSLAECISTAEQEEWSALEGITRVNSLLSIPRFLSGDRRSLSWRRWL